MAYGELSVVELLEAVAAPTPAPASGTSAALAAALAAALVELAAAVSADEETRAAAAMLRPRLLELADEDAAAYTEFMHTRSAEARARTISVPEEIASAAAEIGALAEGLTSSGKQSVRGDALAAVELARGAQRAAEHLVEINQGE